jgi:Tol biopolymer transport system component
VITKAYRFTPTSVDLTAPLVMTTRASVRSDGAQATSGYSDFPTISADGRWITYHSSATNLVDGDTNNGGDVFLFDRDTGVTRRVSVRSNGDQATGQSYCPAISADGRWITYTSNATNLVDDDTNKAADVFLFDRDTGVTRRVSVRSDGDQATGGESVYPAISANGRWITYDSGATNLVDNDTNDMTDVFLFDRDTGVTRRVSVRSNGDQATGGGSWGPAISADGRWVTFTSYSEALVNNDTNTTTDVFLFDRDTGVTRRVSVRSNGDQATGGYSDSSAISADGQWITYHSTAVNLVDGDTNDKRDVFLFDRDTGVTRRVSVRSNGDQATGSSGARLEVEDEHHPAISADGRWITYHSDATNLVDNDTNTATDVFLARMW